jgi:hypothetical protein
MSGTLSRAGEAGQRDGPVAAGKPVQARLRGPRRRTVAVLVLVVLGAGAGAAWAAGAFRSDDSSQAGPGAPPPATQPVVREDLSSQVPVSATLGYADSYTVRG